MKDRSFISTEVIKILGLPQRRITHLVSNGLVEPVQDAKGAGSKRLYSYRNLLEFSLAEALFELGFGIYFIKKIFLELKKEGIFQFWAEDFSGYLDYLAEKHIQWAKDYLKRHRDQPWPHKEVIERGDNKTIKKMINLPKAQLGSLFYCFRNDGENEIIIVPQDLIGSIGITSLYTEIFDSKSVIIVNLGDIKEKLNLAIIDKG